MFLEAVGPDACMKITPINSAEQKRIWQLNGRRLFIFVGSLHFWVKKITGEIKAIIGSCINYERKLLSAVSNNDVYQLFAA